MKIENSFTVDAPIERAWEVLTDIPTIAPCLPGAKLESSDGDTHKGRVKVKVGPVTAEYTGQATFVEKDASTHRAVINGKGRDTRGAGNAQALITAQMTDVGGGQTKVDIDTDLKVSGKVAQFGRGVMQDVSEKLLGQFAECVAGKLVADQELTPPPIAPQDAPETAAMSDVSQAASTATDTPATATTSTATPSQSPSDEDDAIDLLDVAGNAVWKRAAPVAGVALALVILRALLRRRR